MNDDKDTLPAERIDTDKHRKLTHYLNAKLTDFTEE